MKRTVVVVVAAFLALEGLAEVGSQKTERDYRLYNVVPMCIGRETEQAARCVEMEARTGEDLALYSLTLHPEGRPAREKVDRYVASYRAFVQALAGTRVRPGILVQSILGHWPRNDKDIEPWERTIDQDGKKVRFCPLAPGFGAYIDYVFASLAKERPAFILTDDDVRAYSHGAECFCETHVKLFNVRRGTNYDSDSLRAAVRAGRKGEPDYDTFLALQREMMEQAVAGRIRAAIDAVDPTIPAGICVPGEEHYLCEPLARRMAAKGQTPVMRCSTGLYCERMEARAFPSVFMRMAGFVEAFRGRGIDLLDEADTCPQNLWSKSARAFYTHMAASSFVGMKGAKTWYVNGLRANGVPVTKAYTDVLALNRGQLDALARAVVGTEACGLAVPCFTRPDAWHAVTNHSEFFVTGQAAEQIAIPFGIPVTSSREFGRSDVVFMLDSEREVARFTDAELKRLLSGRVIVFREAALALTRRGCADLTGVTAQKRKLAFSAERDNMNGGVLLSFSPGLSGSVELTAAPGAERLSDFVYSPYNGARAEVVAPASVHFRNALGGEIVTMAYCGSMYYLQQYSEGRKRWFVSCVDRLTGPRRLAVCGNDQDVLVAERAKPDGSRLVMAVNLNPDPINRLRLRVPETAEVSVLDATGIWRPIAGTRAGDYLEVEQPIAFYEAAFLRVIK